MYSISKEFSFSAAHYLEGLDEGHPCSRMHGHNYVVRLEVRTASLSDVGFVIDYRDLSEFKEGIDSQLDHRSLNDVMIVNPTAENLSKWLWERARAMLNPKMEPIHEEYGLIVHVSETPKTWATYDGHVDA